jgi:lambda repressor-like predicted transcriptional regulator
MQEYSKGAIVVKEAMTEDEIKQIQKDNPFRNERNDKIIGLWKKGVSLAIISEISGLSDTALGHIVRRKRKYQRV